MWSDRVNFVIPWDRFPKGTSVFIPSLDLQYTTKAVLKEAKQHNINIKTRIVVENGIMGVRIWHLD